MKYEYPKICSTLIYKKVDAYTVDVTDFMNETSFTFGVDVASFVKKLDGYTDPYKISSVLLIFVFLF